MLNKYNLGDRVRTKIHDENDSRTEVDGVIRGIEIDNVFTLHIRYEIALCSSDAETILGCADGSMYVAEEDIIGIIPVIDDNKEPTYKIDILMRYQLNNTPTFNLDNRIDDIVDSHYYTGYDGYYTIKTRVSGYTATECENKVISMLDKLLLYIASPYSIEYREAKKLYNLFELVKKEITEVADNPIIPSPYIVERLTTGEYEGTTIRVDFMGFLDDRHSTKINSKGEK